MDKKIWYAPNKFESYGEEEIKAVEEFVLKNGSRKFLERNKDYS
jgi:CDP-6-deoxy-D-xylo-4-hexulose-3-dehydrase